MATRVDYWTDLESNDGGEELSVTFPRRTNGGVDGRNRTETSREIVWRRRENHFGEIR